MGACSIGLMIKGDATPQRVQEVVDAQRREDEYNNGHQEGYSGDWQTIYSIRHYTGKVFDSADDAWDYALDQTEKREAISVRFKNRDGEIMTLVAGIAAE